MPKLEQRSERQVAGPLDMPEGEQFAERASGGLTEACGINALATRQRQHEITACHEGHQHDEQPLWLQAKARVFLKQGVALAIHHGLKQLATINHLTLAALIEQARQIVGVA